MFLPGVREAADGFPEAHGKLGYGFQALDGAGREPVAPREEQFGIAEDAGQRIINFVTQDLAEIAGQVIARKSEHPGHPFSQTHATVEQTGGDGQEMVRMGDKIDSAGGN